MTERDVIKTIAMQLVYGAGQQFTRMVPGIQAVCITLVGKNRELPLGGIICHPDHLDSETLLRALARLSDQTDILVRKLLGEDTDGVDTDGQDSPSLAAQGQEKRVANAGDGSADQEDQGANEAPEGGTG